MVERTMENTDIVLEMIEADELSNEIAERYGLPLICLDYLDDIEVHDQTGFFSIS